MDTDPWLLAKIVGAVIAGYVAVRKFLGSIGDVEIRTTKNKAVSGVDTLAIIEKIHEVSEKFLERLTMVERDLAALRREFDAHVEQRSREHRSGLGLDRRPGEH